MRGSGSCGAPGCSAHEPAMTSAMAIRQTVPMAMRTLRVFFMAASSSWRRSAAMADSIRAEPIIVGRVAATVIYFTPALIWVACYRELQ